MNPKHTRELLSERLSLQPVRDEDISLIYQGLSDQRVVKYYGVSFDSLEKTKIQMEWYRNLESEGTGIWWTVRTRSNGTFIGAGGFNNLVKEHRKAEIGFWLLPEFWGKGYMSEAFRKICHFGFEDLGLHRIEGWVESNNAACIKALIKCGFTLEGTMRECEWKDDHFIDLCLYSQLESEFTPDLS